jgi:uncharacterized protein (DUF58 family)
MIGENPAAGMTSRVRQLRRLLARARGRARGALAGAYASAVRGAGLMFEDVRPYEPGDDVRRIDPAVSARTGVPHVRQYVAERERTVHLVVDASGSMTFDATGGKRAAAAELAALIAFAAAANRDRVGLTLFTDRVERHLRPARGDRAAYRAVRAIFDHVPTGVGTDIGAGLAPLRGGRRAAVFLISDFRAPLDPHMLRAFSLRHQVTAIRVADPAEIRLPNMGRIRVRDAESAAELVLNTSDPRVRSAYESAARAREEDHRQAFRAAGIPIIAVTAGQDHVGALMKYFAAREARA